MTYNNINSATYVGEPKKGAKRIVERFLFFPKSVRGEVRWLTRARISQVYTNSREYWDFDCSWKNLEFVNPPTKQ